mmetsp:Transcript_25658/g.41326  ORF Transcript_25658/g.41326 Transcript_25658/m.41326 type:complete len:203 (-) Transcript_25658:1231-1839(-)
MLSQAFANDVLRLSPSCNLSLRETTSRVLLSNLYTKTVAARARSTASSERTSFPRVEKRAVSFSSTLTSSCPSSISFVVAPLKTPLDSSPALISPWETPRDSSVFSIPFCSSSQDAINDLPRISTARFTNACSKSIGYRKTPPAACCPFQMGSSTHDLNAFSQLAKSISEAASTEAPPLLSISRVLCCKRNKSSTLVTPEST